MDAMILHLLHPTRFQALLTDEKQYPLTLIQQRQKIQEALKRVEQQCQQETGYPAATVTVESKIRNPGYDITGKTIQMQYEPSFTGVRYVWDWAHEHAHHEQSNPNNKHINYQMAQISREFYPTPPLNIWRQPKPAYISNYNEIIARTASLRTLTTAYQDLTRLHDFTVEDREALLPEYLECYRQAVLYQERYDVQAMLRFNQKQVKHYDPSEALYITLSRNEVQQFLNQNSLKLYQKAFHQFQTAIKGMAVVIQQIRDEIGPQRENTKTKQQELARIHQQHSADSSTIRNNSFDKNQHEALHHEIDSADSPLCDYDEIEER